MSAEKPDSGDADKDNIQRIRKDVSENKYNIPEKLFDLRAISREDVRLYGAIRREGKTSEEADDIIRNQVEGSQEINSKLTGDLEARSAEIEKGRRADRLAMRRAQRMIELGGYPEKLDHPEEYLYHGCNGNPDYIRQSVLIKGLVGVDSPSIDCWVGDDDAHEKGSTNSFGDNGAKYRVKATKLEELGFTLEPYPTGNPAVHAKRENPVIPREYLEIWNEELGLWEPLVETVDLELLKGQVAECLSAEPFDPKQLVETLKAEYGPEYASSSGGKEGYSIEQHTLMAMGQYERYFSGREAPAGVDRGVIRLSLALHDIGKPEALAYGKEELQHEYTTEKMQDILGKLGVSEADTKIALELVSDDLVGRYLEGKITKDETLAAVSDMAEKLSMAERDVFSLIEMLYICDAGSYTSDAGGVEALDSSFHFDHEKGEARLSKSKQLIIDQLGFTA